MNPAAALRYAKRAITDSLVAGLVACAQAPSVPLTGAPPIGNGYPEALGVAEPGAGEIVVVVNDNARMVHAGMFAADRLLDPAGSYEGSRRLARHWPGTSLRDYLRFQLEDGPVVRLYRFTLSSEGFGLVQARLDQAGGTLPFFCAARVQNVITGIEPFASVPDAWLISPATLANTLDLIISDRRDAGACYWPNGSSCYARPADEGLSTASK